MWLAETRRPCTLPAVQALLETIRALSEGNTTLADNHIREGVVVKPVIERSDPRIGRAALKYVGDSCLFSKSADRDTHDV